MRNATLASLTVVLVALACGPGESAPKPEAGKPVAGVTAAEVPARRALLVGIDEYSPETDEKFSRLEGAVADVELVAATLKSSFGFTDADVRTLTNARATHENIVRAFETFLVQPAGPNTEVVFWFSGHGSRVRDESGRAGAEADSRDSTLLAYDSRSKGAERVLDIGDDELHSLLQRLTRKTGRVTVVTDSCHSGGVTRGSFGGKVGVARSGPDATVPVDRARISTFLPGDFAWFDDSSARRDIASRYVHISACTERQLAREYVVSDAGGKRVVHGALTFFLVQALREASPGDSYRKILRHAQLLVSTYIPGQTAVIEGFVDRKLFSGEFAARPSGFPARFRDGRIMIGAGTLHGLAKGSIVEVMDYKQNVLCQAVVKTVGVDASFATLIEPVVTKPTEGVPLLASETERPAGSAKLRIRTSDVKARAQLDTQWTAFDAGGDYALRMAETGQPVLVTPDGFRAPCKLGATGEGEALESFARKELRFHELRKLATQRGSFELSAKLVAPDEAEVLAGIAINDVDVIRAVPAKLEKVTARGSVVAPVWRGALRPYSVQEKRKEGELATIEITNHAPRELYLGVLCLSQTREITVLAPDLEERTSLAAGQTARICVWVGFETQDGWPQDASSERYLIVGTTVPISYESFEQGKIERGATRGAKDELPGILKAAIEKPERTRGRKIQTQDKRFGVTWIDFEIRRRSDD